ncbi:MAG TPA: hypothetical protein VIX86_27180 [Streptosporangiaceae bacterium]
MNVPGAVQPLLQEADQLLGEASRRGLVLRLAGSAGVLRHCDNCRDAASALGREPPLDLDFFAYRKQQRELGRMFTSLGYRADPSVAYSQEYGIDRLIYLGHGAAAKVDIFLDTLRMSHTIQFKGRLNGPGPTALPAYLLLAKLQIHEITEKDIKDIAALLASHPLGDGSDSSIDSRHVTGLMAHDWGLCHTTLGNLTIAERLLAGWTPAGGVVAAATARVQELRQQIEVEPKSLRWKARAKMGTRVRWYEDVGDAEQQGQGDAGLRER